MWEILAQIAHLFPHGDADNRGYRDYSLKYPKRRRAGWFSKLVVVGGISYLIYLWLKSEGLLPQ